MNKSELIKLIYQVAKRGVFCEKGILVLDIRVPFWRVKGFRKIVDKHIPLAIKVNVGMMSMVDHLTVWSVVDRTKSVD